MKELFESTQAIVFLTIAVASFIVVCGSLLFDHDADVDHDMDHENEGHDSVSIFSPKIIAVFFLGFGAAGMGATIFGYNSIISSLIGTATGLLIGATSLWMLRILYNQQANSLVGNSSMIGATGQVVTKIPSNGLGEVSFIAGGQSLTKLARSKNNQELSVGKNIKIITAAGDALMVESV